VTIGLVPFLLVEFLSDEGPLRARFRRYLSWSNLCGILLLLFVGLFYLSKLYEASPYARGEIPHGFFLAGSASPLGRLGLLVTFWLVEVGIYALLLFKSLKSEERRWRWLFGVTLVYLALLPLYKAGIYNDLPMRASIPALFCLAVLVGRAAHRNDLGLRTRVVLIFVLVLGAATPVAEFRFNISGIYGEVMGRPIEKTFSTRGIVEVYQGMSDHFLQYVGAYESPFFQYFSKEQAWTSRSELKRYTAFLDNKILFEGYDLEKDTALRPGEQVRMTSRVHVFFEAVDKNYNISLRLVAEEDGKEVWREQGWPANRPTSIWAPTVLWFDTRTLTIPADAPVGFYRLDLSFVDPDSHELLPAFAVPAGMYLGEMVPVGYLTVGEVESRPAHAFPKPVQLAGKAALVGLTPAPDQTGSLPASRGEPLNIQLFWQALAEMDRDYTGFVHLLDTEGDGYTIVMPEDTSPGTYSLVAGMYDLQSGVRLPIVQNGENVGDSVLLAHVEVR
jgi:hypothetical protein